MLQLLADHPVPRVRQAAEDALRKGELRAEWVQAEVQRLAAAAGTGAAGTQGRESVGTPLSQYHVPRPDLGQFDQLLNRGGYDHDGE